MVSFLCDKAGERNTSLHSMAKYIERLAARCVVKRTHMIRSHKKFILNEKDGCSKQPSFPFDMEKTHMMCVEKNVIDNL